MSRRVRGKVTVTASDREVGPGSDGLVRIAAVVLTPSSCTVRLVSCSSRFAEAPRTG
ncbi:hypothetical protein [Microbacterium sp. NIBRBAC000506063]|uniref:hypothetical protein n=1 Tax=Microbacterium sp. NIBRBAC000506063 TaxID=2734618 RepID=UPI001BB51FE5|nr:hypothetical protein [Microbacterium sp. NIBRBAC000506063]QTV80182.1 hypothetical protein KAE78_03840 [Microbacterium sp. NIBRBAC000506063]